MLDVHDALCRELCGQAQEEVHRDKALLSVATQELERLERLWKLISESRGASLGLTRSRHELQSEITQVSSLGVLRMLD